MTMSIKELLIHKIMIMINLGSRENLLLYIEQQMIILEARDQHI